MAGIFEDLMRGYGNLTESTSVRSSRVVSQTKTEAKKIKFNKIKLESRKIFEDSDFDELDKQFSVDPEESEDDEVVLVIDPEISGDEEVPEDAAESMIGDLVYKCPVCGGNYVCNCDAEKNESVEVDENGVPTECPICGDDTEQILVGEIAPAEGAGEEKDLPDYSPDDSEDTDEEVKEFEETDEDAEDVEEVKEEDESVSRTKKESKKPSMKSMRRKEGCNSRKSKKLKEDDEYEEEEEAPAMDPAVDLIDEVDDSSNPAVEINAQTVNLSLDDKKFESYMNSIIKENYKNNSNFKVTSVRSNGSTLKIEYVVRSKGGKSRKGTLVGEGYNPKSRKSTIKFRDKGAFTESFSRSPSFIVEFVRIRNSMIPTGVKYDYKVKVNESLYRVYGKVGK